MTSFQRAGDMRKTVVTAALAAVLGVGLAACGGTGSAASPGGGSTAADGTCWYASLGVIVRQENAALPCSAPWPYFTVTSEPAGIPGEPGSWAQQNFPDCTVTFPATRWDVWATANVDTPGAVCSLLAAEPGASATYI
jgi:hypothetical protein